MIMIFIIYFIIDFSYQIIICNKTYLNKKIYNSLINSITPAIFIFIGYIIANILRDVKPCNNIDMLSGQQVSYIIRNDELYNIHRNNIICGIIFYIFSIFYSNPINKKKCINNKLC